ncbi:MAG: hypothetical protein II065_03810, partial [Bacteroidaceae bacterium]|nr:hypothetical protein [Bacteroidaceae bacterium]
MDKKYPQIKMKFLLCVLSDEDMSVYSDYRVVSNEYFIDYDSEVEKLYREKLSYGICYYKNRIIFVADRRSNTTKKIFKKTSEALKIVLPIAMRYTEARLQKFAEEMLDDLDKDTVDFQNNYDDSLQEPTVLPTQIPTLLVNGTNGIAVGMA